MKHEKNGTFACEEDPVIVRAARKPASACNGMLLASSACSDEALQ
jgi:hypothetical protein